MSESDKRGDEIQLRFQGDMQQSVQLIQAALEKDTLLVSLMLEGYQLLRGRNGSAEDQVEWLSILRRTFGVDTVLWFMCSDDATTLRIIREACPSPDGECTWSFSMPLPVYLESSRDMEENPWSSVISRMTGKPFFLLFRDRHGSSGFCLAHHTEPEALRNMSINDRQQLLEHILHVGQTLYQLQDVRNSQRDLYEQQQVLLNQPFLGIVILQSGRVRFVNATASTILGYDQQALLRMEPYGFARLIDPDFREFAFEQAKKKERGDENVIPHYSYKVITASGERKWLSQFSKTIVHEGKPADLIMFMDITLQRKIEELAGDQEELLEILIRQPMLGVAIVRGEMAEPVFTNDEFRKIFAIDIADEGIAEERRGLLDVVGESGRCQLQSLLSQSLSRDVPASEQKVTVTLNHPDGTTKRAECYAYPISYRKEPGLLVFAIDISRYHAFECLLSEIEETWRTFIEAVDDIVYFQDLDGSMTLMNHAFESITGYSIDEFEQDSLFWKTLLHEDDLATYEAFFSANPRGCPRGEMFYRMRTKENQFRWIHSRKTGIFDRDGMCRGYNCIDRDVTLQKQAEERLRLFGSAAEQSSEGMALIDLEGDIQFINRAFAQMHGYEPKDLIGRNMSVFYRADQADVQLEESRHIQQQGFFSGEKWHVHRSGQEFPTLINSTLFRDDRGMPVGIISTVRDITRRKAMEAALAESEKRLRTIIESEPECVQLISRDGFIMEINRAGLEVLELDSLSEISATGCSSMIVPEHLDAFKTMLASVFKGNREVLEFDIIGLKGTFRSLEMHAVPLVNRQDQIIACLAVSRDMTERKRAVQALMRSEERYRSLIEQASDSIFIIDAEGAIIEVNKAAVSLLGYPDNALVGRNLLSFIDPGDLKQTPPLLPEIEQYKSFFIERHLITASGAVIVVEFGAKLMGDGQIQVIARDITERVRTESMRRAREQRLLRHNAAVLSLMSGPSFSQGDLSTMLHEITEMAAKALDVGRVNFWTFEKDLNSIRGIDCYDQRTNTHSHGDVLHAADNPLYFKAIMEERIIVIHDAIADVRMSPFADNYLTPNGISSLIDAPVWLKGEPIGVLCHEHVGPQRMWEVEEQLFAATVADLVSLAVETSERWKSEQALRESEERYSLAARGANDGLWDWNMTTHTIYYSPRWKAMLGCRDDEIGNSPDEWFNRVHPADASALLAIIDAHRNGTSDHFENEHRVRHHDNSYIWVLARGLIVRDENGKAIRMAGSKTDITDRKRAEQQLLHDAFHDALTGLPNKALFLDRLEHAMAWSCRYAGYGFAVLCLDLDRFKLINDSLGHSTGDGLLITISRRLKTNVRPGDTVARLGGDEFAILLDDIRHPEEVTTLSNLILEELQKPMRILGYEVYTTASIGIALSTSNHDNPEFYLRDADTALHRVKSEGRSAALTFNNAMHDRAMDQLKLEMDLRRALERDEFCLFYQPIVNITDGAITNFEALIRWRHPERGMVLPAEFIPLAEETGLILSIDRWVMSTASHQLKTWEDNLGRTFPVGISVNQSGHHFSRFEFLDLLRSVRSDNSDLPNKLTIEITESTIMQNIDHATVILMQARDLGFGLSIDDFGTGYSSLAYLFHFPIDTLKIDRSFIQNLGSDSDKSTIVQAIINLARSMNVSVTAEGVESPEQLSILQKLGCTHAQGFFFAVPLPADEAEELIQRKTLW